LAPIDVAILVQRNDQGAAEFPKGSVKVRFVVLRMILLSDFPPYPFFLFPSPFSMVSGSQLSTLNYQLLQLASRPFSHKNMHALCARAARFASHGRDLDRGRPVSQRSCRAALSSTPLKTRPVGRNAVAWPLFRCRAAEALPERQTRSEGRSRPS